MNNQRRSIKAQLSRYRRSLRFRARKLTAAARMLPDFLIIGAQKGGTTSLYAHLTQHPNVSRAFEKEVRYFNDHFAEGVDWYKAHFPTVAYRELMTRRLGNSLITGEGEPSYLANPVVPQRVLDLTPDVKLIVMLRDPVSRAYSHYQHRFTRNRETRTFEEVVAADKEVLKDGWENIPTGNLKSLGHLHYSYLPRGVYADQVSNWLSVFPREQFLFIRAEDFFADTQEIYNETLDFLGLPEHNLEERRRHNVGKYAEPMSAAMKQDLADYFLPHNQRLYEILGRDFGWDD